MSKSDDAKSDRVTSQRRPDRCVCPTPFAVLGHTFCMECLLTLREPFASMICEPVQPEAPPA